VVVSLDATAASAYAFRQSYSDAQEP
jgi:hypothetical protein